MISGLSEIWSAYQSSRERWNPQQTSLGKDRRVFGRVTLKTACRLVHPMFGLESQCSTVDVGLGGMALLGPVNWPEGSRVQVQVDALGFRAEAIIVDRRTESSQFRYSVKFQNLGFWQLIKLRRQMQPRGLVTNS